MCCIAEIGMLVFGIVTLVKGSFTVSRNRVVYGTPAYIIGAILVMVLPTIFVIGLGLGIVMAAQGQAPSLDKPGALVAIDPAVVLLALTAITIISFSSGQPAKGKKRAPTPLQPMGNPPFQPLDPNNPYAAPQSDDRDRLLDEMQ
ncbi:MAG TPA: hypothetical protein VHC22_24950 [Pirellulales bacterium]|nr:hypothetical protein [Pirellulales bacterium]